MLPSESESFGMVLMEAWAQGVPTVASNVGGCREISQASGGGYLAPVGDADAFAGNMLALLTDPKSASIMGQKGKAWVDQNCNPADYAAKFESVIHTCQSQHEMNLTSKVKSVASNPAMLSAYARWVGSKLFCGKPPRLPLPGGASDGRMAVIFRVLELPEHHTGAGTAVRGTKLGWQNGGAGTAFDIGANVGVFTCLMASLGHAVHAFEPVPETFCRLKNNVKFNGLLGRARLNCLAVGKEQGLVTFHIEENAAATNRMALPEAPATNSAPATSWLR